MTIAYFTARLHWGTGVVSELKANVLWLMIQKCALNFCSALRLNALELVGLVFGGVRIP